MLLIRSILVTAFVLALTLPLAAQDAPTHKPVPEIDRVIIMSIDGLRPDLMLRADAPHLRSLLDRGSFSMWARTIPEAITLPSHTSMLTGVHTKQHGITWNNDHRAAEDRHPPKVPSLFALARQAGLTTALVTGKEKFVVFIDEGAVDWHAIPSREVGLSDRRVGEVGVTFLQEHQPNVMVLHFGQVDWRGHGIGWGSPEQIAQIENADAAVGKVFQALDDLGLADSTLVIISADHGGQGRRHGANDARSLHIPWIAVGPGVRPGFDLTRIDTLQIDTYDTFATACHALGLAIPDHVEGKPITEIFAERELLQSE